MTQRAFRRRIRPSLAVLVALVTLMSLALAQPASAQTSEISLLLRCQRTIAKAGGRYANKTIKGTLKCTNEIVECQVNCEEGVYGPACSSNPPPCCDPDDPGSNAAFGECMDDAEDRCDREEEKIADAEIKKQESITSKCQALTTEQLCGAETPGLNYSILTAGCTALIPGWTCDLPNLLACVGGPLQQQLGEQIAELLDPRAGEALTAAGLSSQFAGISQVFKIKESLPAGKIDLYMIEGTADEGIIVTVKTFDDTGAATSSLEPILTYIGNDGTTPVANTSVVETPCSIPSSCGAACPTFKRRFPFSGPFYLAVSGGTSPGCVGGEYQLVVKTEGAAAPSLVLDDVDSLTP